jgi:hypothetical protein
MKFHLRPLPLVVAALAILAVLEQFSDWHLYLSRSWSTTRVSSLVIPIATGVSPETVERPKLRWLPFLKYGETVHILTTERVDSAKTVVADTSTTRTTVLLIGFCSTRKYDSLADGPAEKARAKFHPPTLPLAGRPISRRADR